MTGPEMPSDFLSDNNTTNGWRNDGRHYSVHFGMIGTQPFGQSSTDLGRNWRILKQQGTLEKLSAVKAGT
jgi:hypothetical protein